MFWKAFKRALFFNAHLKSVPKTVIALGKSLPVHTRGTGAIPLLVLGQATLFKKPGFIPAELDKYFTLYFVDLFEKTQKSSLDFSHLTLDDFVDQIENVRLQLKLNKIALFGHSAPGVMVMEYAIKYPKNMVFNILVGTSPIWGDYKNQLSMDFFKANASLEQQVLFNNDQEHFNSIAKKLSGAEYFVQSYYSRRAHFFYQPTLEANGHIWDGIHLDADLITQYFLAIRNYDLRKRPYNAKKVPTFLALGLYDYSCPFYAWTNETRTALATMEHYIFDKSAHFPMLEQPDLFTQKLLECIHSGSFLASAPAGLRAKL